MDERVSIIVPVYNAEEFLERTIESVLKQTYKNIELILVNDGSKDNSEIICNNYAQEYPNIKVLHQINLGPGKAKNEGLRLAEGDYVIFLDCDDMLTENAVSVLMKKAIETEADMVMPDRYYSVDEADNVLGVKYHFSPELCIEEPEKFALITMMGAGRGWRSHSLLFKKESVDKQKICFIDRSTVDDYFFNLECMKHFKKLAYINQCTVYYRTRQNSITSSFHENFMDMIWKFDNAAEEFINYKKIPDDVAIKYENAVVIRTVIVYIGDIFSEKVKMSWSERILRAKKIIDDDKVQLKFKGDFKNVYFTKKAAILYFKIMYQLIKHKFHYPIYILAKVGGMIR